MPSGGLAGFDPGLQVGGEDGPGGGFGDEIEERERAHHRGVQRCQDGGYIKEADGFGRVSGRGRGHGICGDSSGPPRFKVVLSNG